MSPRGRSYTIEREEAEGGCEAQSHHSHRRRQHHLRCVCAAGAADRQKGPTEKDPVPLYTDHGVKMSKMRENGVFR